MYRIMIAKKKDGSLSLYQYLTSTIDGVVTPVEFETKASLDTYVEKMLNGNYSKSDFIIVKPVDYELNAADYSDDEPAPAPAPDTADTDKNEEPTNTDTDTGANNEPTTQEPATQEPATQEPDPSASGE